MKKYFVTYILLFLSSGIFAQSFQASIQPVPSSSAVTIVVKTPVATTGKISGVTITIAIPVSVGPRPPALVNNSADPFITYTIQNAVDQSIGGVLYYIYNFLGTGDVVSAGATINFAANVDFPVTNIGFGGNPSITSQIKLVNLPDGGTDSSPNSFFGLSIDGVDAVNQTAIFYAIPSVSTAVNDGNGNGGTSFAETIGSVPLPVKFVNLDVTKKKNDAILNWQIENENALTDHYEIERSLNGTDFSKVFTIMAKNNGGTTNSYTQTDLNISSIRSKGIIYYRVKQFDKDGKFIISPIKSLRLDGKGLTIGVFPNPIKNYANVTIDLENDAEVLLTINDASGKQVQILQLLLFKGMNVKKINMGSLAAGSYLMKVQTGTEVQTIPLVKTN